jgi:hypothetical protein
MIIKAKAKEKRIAKKSNSFSLVVIFAALSFYVSFTTFSLPSPARHVEGFYVQTLCRTYHIDVDNSLAHLFPYIAMVPPHIANIEGPG